MAHRIARDALKAWRLKRHLSQDAASKLLARHGGTATQATWGSWELGSKTPDLENAIAIESLTEGVIKAVDWARSRRKGRKLLRRARAAA